MGSGRFMGLGVFIGFSGFSGFMRPGRFKGPYGFMRSISNFNIDLWLPMVNKVNSNIGSVIIYLF